MQSIQMGTVQHHEEKGKYRLALELSLLKGNVEEITQNTYEHVRTKQTFTRSYN